MYLEQTLQVMAADDAKTACMLFADGAEMQHALRKESFDLLILDWSVPGLSGTELLQWLRVWRKDAVPVLMLSARTSEHDVAHALGVGADDYVIKPFRPVELRARVARLLARQRPASEKPRQRFLRWEFDRPACCVWVYATAQSSEVEQYHRLSGREFQLALTLFQNMGRTLSRAHLLESAGYSAEDGMSRTLDSHIYRLRTKLGLEAARGVVLRTMYGRGYCLEALEGEA